MIALPLLAALWLAPAASSTPAVPSPVGSEGLAHTQDELPALPGETDLAVSRRKVRTVFAERFDEADGDRKESRELAAELLAQAVEMADEPVDRCAVLLEAQGLAEFGLDLPGVIEIVGALAAGYRDVDARALEADALVRIGPDLQRRHMEHAAAFALGLVAVLVERGDLDRATAVQEALGSKVRKHCDAATRARWGESKERVGRAAELEAARRSLVEDPGDEAANELLGRHHALVLGDLAGALPYLRRSASTDLLACVAGDVDAPEAPEDQLSLAEAWVALAGGDEQAEPAALTRAAHWYGQALEQLGTLDRVPVERELSAVEKRLAKLAGTPEADPGAATPPAAQAPRVGLTRGGRRNLRAMAGRSMDQALRDGLAWLAAHQAADGSWDCDGFSAACGQLGEGTCDRAGQKPQDVGVTGLALLAFLGEGNMPGSGFYGQEVADGVRWLLARQDPKSGRIGDRRSHDFLYGHAIATMVLAEATHGSDDAELRGACQAAVDFLAGARNPYGVWRYAVPPDGNNDTSITAWAVLALKAAEAAGYTVDEAAYEGALTWFDRMTDPETGRVGYADPGSRSARVVGVNDHFPSESGEAMTAAALLCRVMLGQTETKQHPVLAQHADLLLRTLPEWDEDGFRCDMYYWYYGTYAMYQMGGKGWKAWEAAIKPVLVDAQRQDGDAKGSWDPVGPWGTFGGRVYSTSMMVLTIEAYFRYGRASGKR